MILKNQRKNRGPCIGLIRRNYTPALLLVSVLR